MGQSDPRINPRLDFPPDSVEGVDHAKRQIRSFFIDRASKSTHSREVNADLLVKAVVTKGCATADVKHAIVGLEKDHSVWFQPTSLSDSGVTFRDFHGHLHKPSDAVASIPLDRPTEWNWFDVLPTEELFTESAASLVPSTLETPVTEHANESPSDLFTTVELAKLLGINKDRLLNVLSEERPNATPIKGKGRTPDSYSYSAIRRWLLKKWPHRGAWLPDSYADARRRLDDIANH